ncbi:hypothetical protein E6W36_09335 [Hankyongella ginsenosidimutans]|uniref:Uncharacterized protein n=1 Tax=Hankyongella ginsenosidimutans TaxID=1763828 RepID=A0A4D7C1S6_9SPHN|nr:hypothetical protein [Hankyongella ginsenosidimutans]QCI79664.1 hypothetical protein E6W36_09335 [Hankyongella ginsenosidimutans]
MRLLSALKKLAAAGLSLAVAACGPGELQDTVKAQIERLPRASYEAPKAQRSATCTPATQAGGA